MQFCRYSLAFAKWEFRSIRLAAFFAASNSATAICQRTWARPKYALAHFRSSFTASVKSSMALGYLHSSRK